MLRTVAVSPMALLLGAAPNAGDAEAVDLGGWAQPKGMPVFRLNDRHIDAIAHARLQELREQAHQTRLAKKVRETRRESHAIAVRLILNRYAVVYRPLRRRATPAKRAADETREP